MDGDTQLRRLYLAPSWCSGSTRWMDNDNKIDFKIECGDEMRVWRVTALGELHMWTALNRECAKFINVT